MRISDWSSVVCSSDLMLLGLTYGLLDHYLDQPDYGWIEKWEVWYQARLAGGVEFLKQSKASPAQSGPSLALAGYAGRYRDPWYGEIGRASCRERVCQTCRSRWSPYE